MKKSLFLCLAFIGLTWLPVVSFAAEQLNPEIAPVNQLDLSGQALLSEEAPQITPWGAPVLVSPDNGRALYHYPRKTTLAWEPVTGATSYKVERAYYSGGIWQSYVPVTVTGRDNTSYTFDFVGDQQGRWRVTAYSGTIASAPSAWWTFSYITKAQMPTPIQTNPSANELFSHFPRTVTLSWKMIPAAVGYKLERSYCQAGNINCVDYAPVTITGSLTSFYTFNFVGAQPGRWRVTALGAPTYLNSTPSAWRYFTFDK